MNEEPNKEILEKTTEQWERFQWVLQALVCAVGFLVILSSSYVFYRGAQIYQKYFPLVDASMEMRLEATTAYLWFEEMVGGDNSKNLDDILKHLDMADWYAKSMIEGGDNPHLSLLPLTESVLIEKIIVLQNLLKKQRRLLIERIGSISNSGPGSDIDKTYHSTLEDFISKAKILEIQIKRLMETNVQVFKYIGISGICFFIILFSIIGYAFYRYENLRRKNYSKIQEMQSLLIQKEKMTVLGRMISSITHEVNNPNNFISFNMPILREYLQEILPVMDKHSEENIGLKVLGMPYDEFKNDLHKLLDNIENGSLRINRIVSVLKDFSMKKNTIMKDWFNIRDMIESVVNVSGHRIKSAVDSFEVKIHDDIPKEVFFDSEIVEICLLIFLNNAAEAVNKPNSWIRLDVSRNTEKNNAITIKVKDNGSGIKNEDRQKIFEPFYSTKTSMGGIGMGLYLCHTLIHQIGGNIEVDSEVGVGSEFKLVFDGNS